MELEWREVQGSYRRIGHARPSCRQIEAELARRRHAARAPANIDEVDFKTPYVAAIKNFADLELIAKAGFKFAIDFMYGAGRGVLATSCGSAASSIWRFAAKSTRCSRASIPSRSSRTSRMLQETVVHEHCHAGFATDGDADRIGAVAEDGSFVDAHKCFAILLSGC